MIIDKHKWKFFKCNVVPAFNRLLFDRPSPMFVELFITRRCNLRCSYCFTWRKNFKDPSTEEIKKRIDKLKELGCNVISFMGGEPTLRKDLVELTKYAHKKKMFVSMDTNGTLLSKTLIDKLAKAGMDSVVVSLDGINKLKTSQKTVFNNPSIIDNLEYALKHKGIRAFTNFVLTKENIKEVIPLLELIKNKKIIFAISLITKNPECRINKKRIFNIQKKKFSHLINYLTNLSKRKNRGISCLNL